MDCNLVTSCSRVCQRNITLDYSHSVSSPLSRDKASSAFLFLFFFFISTPSYICHRQILR
jgi:hypothetical protein